MKAAVLVALVLAVPAAAQPTAAPGPDLAVQWNALVLEIAEAEDGFLTLKGVRAAALMHLAMHDVLNGGDGRYRPMAYTAHDPAPEPVAAATQAAFSVASALYPDQRARLAGLRDRWLAQVSDADARLRALAAGSAAADAVLKARRDDGWDTEANYRWHPMAPGVYAEFREHSDTPEGFVFGAGWARARGFALTRPDQFRVPPPPEIDSDEYAAAFDEVREVGRFQTLRRSPEQTHVALWWKDFAENSHNRLARDLVAKENLDLVRAVRLFALLNMSIFDAYVSVFDNKFHYNHWRPYTAIRWAANDGNPATMPEPTWTNTHRHTYAFPSYPSAHGAACAAAMATFAATFGDDYRFTMRTPVVDIAGPMSGKMALHPPTRSFASFSGAADECGLSRLYLGIHFRYDSVAGVALGEQVGRNVIDTLLVARDASAR